jgi:hypothetical protein
MTMGGATMTLLAVGGEVYFKANGTFWKQNGGPAGETMAQMMGNKWGKIKPGDKNFTGFRQFPDPKELLKPSSTLTKGEQETIAGVPAIAIIDSSDQSLLYVATTGEPYLLLIKGPKGDNQLVFSKFGASFNEVKKPAAGDVVDLSKLTSGT